MTGIESATTALLPFPPSLTESYKLHSPTLMTYWLMMQPFWNQVQHTQVFLKSVLKTYRLLVPTDSCLGIRSFRLICFWIHSQLTCHVAVSAWQERQAGMARKPAGAQGVSQAGCFMFQHNLLIYWARRCFGWVDQMEKEGAMEEERERKKRGHRWGHGERGSVLCVCVCCADSKYFICIRKTKN